MQRIGFLLLCAIGISFYTFGQTPVSHPGAPWAINADFTNEFNSGELDLVQWDNGINSWGTWSWDTDNVYLTDTVLTLRMRHETHIRGGNTYHFKSGIYQNEETITYGYYEARIKASEKGQGTCPAFWLYSKGQPTPTEEGGVKYCEIDAVEIFQVPYDFQRLELNLHARIIQNGVLTWIRPGQGYTELTHNTWVAPWDPRDDYHTYGVLNRVDSIFWYVDGVQRGAKKNHYWHLPMYPTLSMGLRTPYEMYINGVRTVMPYPDSIPEPGFPTEMYCDYIRTWNTPPQLYADREVYYDASFPVNSTLEFDCRYFAGNDEMVLSDGWNGMSCKLQELDGNGMVINEYENVDASAVGKEHGLTTFEFSLDGFATSAELPEGHQYVLRPVFPTTFNDGEYVYMAEEYYPIQLVMASGVNDPEAKEKIKIFSNANGVTINMEDIGNHAEIAVHDLSGRRVFYTNTSSNTEWIGNEQFPASGVYVVSVMTNRLHRVEKVVVMKD